MNAKPSSSKGRPAHQKASRAPHRKITQAQERKDTPTRRPGARECDPAGPAGGQDQQRAAWCGFPPAGCPIALDINQVIDLSEDLNRAMRQLRRKLDACEKCSQDDRCGFRRAFQERIKAVVAEVAGEWSMP
jgi:hypothetical protein